MKQLKKMVLYLIFLPLVFLYSNETRFVTDTFGNKIEIPYSVTKVAPLIPAFAQMTCMLGHQDDIVASRVIFSDMFHKVFPGVKKANPNNMLSTNVETLIASGAQVAYGPTSFFMNDIQKNQLKKANVAVVDISNFATIEGMKSCISSIAQILGKDAIEKADKFNAYYEQNMEKIRNRTQNLINKPTVLLLGFSAGNYRVSNGRDISSVYANTAGGINVAQNLELGGSSFVLQVNTEQILTYNPDIIIASSNEAKERVLSEKAFKDIKAIKTKSVYVTPSGVFIWSARSAEGALQPLWLATKFYPEKFSDINMEQEVKFFYKTFYNYELNEEELNSILFPKK